MKSLRLLSLLIVVPAFVVTGCGGQASSELVVSSDPRLAAMAAELLPGLAARAGMTLNEPVRLEERSREDLVRYLEWKLEEELPADEARSRTESYALLGLVSDDLDLRAVLMGLYTEQVAGFYEPDSTALFVLDDQPEAAVEALLVHELVHAVQDQNVPLDELTDPTLGNDRARAAQAAIEGHATLVMFEYLTEQMTGAAVDLGSIPDFQAQMRPALASIGTQFPALAEAPRVIRESLLFPYVDGAGFVQRLWSEGERVTPFGSRLPRSSEQVLHPGAADPVTVELTLEAGEPALLDQLGAHELQIFVEEVLGLPGEVGGGGEAGALAAGWDGDAYVLARNPAGAAGLVWVVAWSDVERRDRFLSLVRAAADRLGGPATASALTVDGVHLSRVTIGVEPGSVAVSVGRAGS